MPETTATLITAPDATATGAADGAALVVVGVNSAISRASFLTPEERRAEGCPPVILGAWDDRTTLPPDDGKETSRG